MKLRTGITARCSSGEINPGRPLFLRHQSAYLAAVLIVSLLGACRSNDNKQIIVGNESQLAGSIDADSLQSTGGNIRAFVVNRDGYRDELPNFVIQDGTFDLGLAGTNIVPRPMVSPPELFAFMGYTLPADHAVFQGKFGEKAVGFARIELIGGDAAKAGKATVPYAQLLVPVSRRSVLAGQDPLVMVGRDAGKIKIDTKFAYLKVRILDKVSGVAIPGADVTSISLVNRLPVLTGDDPNFGPVYSSTDADGKADLYGIRSTAGSDPTLQILARASGYCRYVSPPEAFVVSQNVARDVVLEKCDESLQKPGAIQLAFGDGIKTSSIEIDGKVENRGLVNSDTIEIKVLTAADVLRPLKIQVFEGDKAEGQPRFDKKLTTFASLVQVETPTLFSGGRSGSGAFVVSIQEVFSDADRAAHGAAPVQLLYGLKSVEKPVVRAEDFTFKSAAGIEGVISGRSGIAFSVSYAKCQDGGNISAWLGGAPPSNSTLKFVSCVAGGAKLNAEDVGLASGGLGGTKTAFIFYKDPYGNVNQTLLTGTEGKKDVYVDFGAPDLTSQPVILGTDYGIAPKGDPKGTAGQAYIFSGGIALTPGNLGNYVIRFANTEACKHSSPSAADGQNPSDKGNLIASYVIGQSPAVVQAQTVETSCPDDRNITPLDISFPAASGDAASMYLRVRDLAGNMSEPFRVSIPPCVSQTTTGHVCWYNPP